MSADEYQSCPICGGIPEAYRKFKDQYGKVSLDEFLHLKNVASQKTNDQPVAIYQEITLNADHTMNIQISAECSVCKAGWLFNIWNVNGGKKP
jgi:hypothetical protein